MGRGSLFSAIFIIFILGGFYGKVDPSAGGLGHHSANFNALINPQGWSKIFKDMPLYGGGQYEGFAWLGAGVIFLVAVNVIVCFHNNSLGDIIKNRKKEIFAIVLVSIIGYILAVSPIGTLGAKVLYSIKLPKIVEKLYSVFRASGRISWVAVYAIMICMPILLSKLFDKKKLVILISVCFLLQVIDMGDIIKGKRKHFNREVQYESFMRQSDFWKYIGNNYDNFIFTTNMPFEKIIAFSDFAFDNNMSVNTFYFARANNSFADNLEKSLQLFSPKDVFIFTDDNKQICVNYDLHYYEANGFVVGVKNAVPPQYQTHGAQVYKVDYIKMYDMDTIFDDTEDITIE